MNKSCENCKFWNYHVDEYDAGWYVEFGKCNQTPHGADLGEWKDPGGDEDCQWVMEEEFKDRTAVVMDGSGYMATLYTKSDHFCSMYREKDSN